MIEREIKKTNVSTPSILNPVYKLLVVLLLLVNSKSTRGVSIGRIQVILWGVCGKPNKQVLLNYKKDGILSMIPISLDNQLSVILADAEDRGWIKQVADGKSYSRYKITLKGRSILVSLKNFNLYKEIESELKDIQYIPDTKIDHINYVWTNDLF